MRYIRFESVGGASGDMLLSALVSIGADLKSINRTVRACLPEPVSITDEPATSHGLHGIRVSVHLSHAHQEHHWPDAGHHPAAHHHAPHRTLKDVAALLNASKLDAGTRKLALAVFTRLAEVEGRIHGRPSNRVHFHEIGASDSIADIVGCCLALKQLDVAGVSVGPLPAGTGVIHCAHGVMPNPAPATVELLAGLSVVQTDEPFELVTPTGAALLAAWRETLATPPAALRVLRSGFGFGRKDLKGRPNVIRATLLESDSTNAPQMSTSDAENLMVLECNLDDCNPQWIGDLIPRLLAAGALDAWAMPATMKKGRPGLVLSALAPAAAKAAITDLIFAATTTFGVRSYSVTRDVLDRRFETVKTPFGPVRVKIGSRQGRDQVRTPEFEDCVRCARAHTVAPRQVAEAAMRRIPHASGKISRKRKR